MTDATQQWLEAGYADIVRCSADTENISVEFANGDTVVLSAASFGIPPQPFTVDFNPDEGLSIQITTGDAVTTTVSWSQIRARSDPRFAQELRRRDTEESRRLGARLRALREDKNLTQRDVARLMDMPAPQLSKIENGTYDLRTSTVRGLLRAMDATYDDISGPGALETSQRTLRSIAERVGIPGEVFARLIGSVARGGVPALLDRAFGWDPRESGADLPRLAPLPIAVAFKTIGSADPSHSPLVSLGVSLSKLALSAIELPDYEEIPAVAAEVRRLAIDESGQVTLSSLLEYAWRSGIAVLSMAGRGGFSAAVWVIDDRPAIVLKESRGFIAYWLFDLAHELAHIALGHTTKRGLVEIDSPTARHTSHDGQEEEADAYALTLLMPDHEALLDEVRTEARGNYLRFKGAVASVAARHRLSVGLLGMVAAYELTEVGQEKDRWGSASNLARDEGEGRAVAVAAARRYLSVDGLDPLDALLMTEMVLS